MWDNALSVSTSHLSSHHFWSISELIYTSSTGWAVCAVEFVIVRCTSSSLGVIALSLAIDGFFRAIGGFHDAIDGFGDATDGFQGAIGGSGRSAVGVGLGLRVFLDSSRALFASFSCVSRENPTLARKRQMSKHRRSRMR